VPSVGFGQGFVPPDPPGVRAMRGTASPSDGFPLGVDPPPPRLRSVMGAFRNDPFPHGGGAGFDRKGGGGEEGGGPATPHNFVVFNLSIEPGGGGWEKGCWLAHPGPRRPLMKYLHQKDVDGGEWFHGLGKKAAGWRPAGCWAGPPSPLLPRGAMALSVMRADRPPGIATIATTVHRGRGG